VEASGKALLRENALRQNYQCERVAITVEIGPDGDARRFNNVRGFRYLGEGQIQSVPNEVGVTVGTGQIERLRISSDSPGSPVIPVPLWSERKRREQRGQIRLSTPITKESKPFNFTWQCDLSNCFAMSAQQYRAMYTGYTGEPVEFSWLDLRFPTAEATIFVKLPERFVIEGEPWLSITRPDGSPEQRLEDSYRSHLVFFKQSNVIFARLPFAPLGLKYSVQWRLSNSPPPAGRPSYQLEGQIQIAATKLLKLARMKSRNNPVSELLTSIENQARSEFKLDCAERDPLALDIMAFDPQDKKLRVAAANFHPDDPQWDHTLDYGDGIAGRAYKMNRVRLFVKARTVANDTPFYYVLTSGEALSDSGSEIPVEALLSLPLSHPDQPEKVFGILNISSSQASSNLVDITEDAVASDFCFGVSVACLELLRTLVLTS